MYTHALDPATTPADVIGRQLDEYASAGIQHLVVALSRRDIDSWLRSMDELAAIMNRHRS
jgi:hypothetical protein